MYDIKAPRNHPNSQVIPSLGIKPKKQASLKRINLTKPDVTQYPRQQPTTVQQQQINELAIELKSTMMKMETQLARRNLLVKIVKSMEQKAIKKGQTGEEENQELRKMKRLQTEINIYSNSNNEVVAKTKIMKQEILAGRKNRAMFSVLFRDIEKDIKNSQDQFKEMLLLSQQTLTKYRTVRKIKEEALAQRSQLSPMHQLLYDTINLNPSFTTQPTITNQAMNFYGGKKAITYIKPRKQYIGSMRNICVRDTTEDTYQNLTNFIEKVCSVTQLSLPKMKDAMGSNGLSLKNDELYKKVLKVNEHINKYEKKCENLLQAFKMKDIVEKDQNKQENVGKSKNKSLYSDEQIYSQLLILTNIKKPLKSQSNIVTSLKEVVINPLQIKTHDSLKEKLNIILEDPPAISPPKQIKDKIQIQQNIKPNTSQMTLHNVLTNMKVYTSYERAFERMQFQTEYYYERNRRNKKTPTFNTKK